MTRRTLELAAFFAALLIASLAFHAWLASHDDQLRLQSTLAAQKQLLDAADARERTRVETLDHALAQITETKRTTQTPAQILRELPKYLALPQPITAETRKQQGTDLSENPHTPAGTSATGEAPSTVVAQVSANLPDTPAARIPSTDLKPLFDFVQDCRSCQTQLATAKQNAQDDNVKLEALTRERDAAIRASKGGGFWRRLKHNVIWFAVGAGAGAASGFVVARR